MRIAFCFYIFVFLTNTVCAQSVVAPDTAQLFYRHFTVQDGLPSNEVYFGFQDKSGYIWICTDNGISRFDGIQFKNYNKAEGLSSNLILGCKEDEKGRLWAYSSAGELYRYQALTDNFEGSSFNDSLAHILGGRPILDLVFEKDTVYVTTVGAYVKLVLKPQGFASLSYVENELMTLTAKVLSNGKVVVINSTEENVTRFNFEVITPHTRTTEVIRNIPINGLVQQQLSSLIAGNDLYIVFGENFLTYNFLQKKWKIEILPFSHNPFLKKSSIGILSGSHGKGLWLLKSSADGFTYKQLIKNKNISGCFEDKQGGIWGCSQTDGVYFIPNHTAFSFAKSEKETSQHVTAMFTSGDSAFYMTYSGALYLISAKELLLQKRLIEPGEYNMRDMKALNRNEILLFPGRTMNYSISTGKISSISTGEICERGSGSSQPVISAVRDKLFLKTCNGKSFNEKIIYSDWKYGRIFSQTTGNNGKVWLGTMNDLIYFDPSGENTAEIGKKNGLSKFSVNYLLSLSEDSVLAASNQGVFLIVKDQIRKSITIDNGLSSNKVNTLFILDGELWVGTSKGIDRIKNYKNVDKAVVVSVTGLTGISKCSVTHLGCIGNYLIAGTDVGVYLFDRKKFFYKPVQVTPFITGLTVNNAIKITDLVGELELKHSENSIDVHFNALNYRNSLLNKYRFRLKNGNEPDWSFTSQNHISFQQLSPGMYEFELQAMNPDGSWNQSTSHFIITIKKPFWLTWWFITLCVIAIGSATYLLLLFRIKQLQKFGHLTGELSEAKMHALGMQLNPHFVFNALNSVSAQIAKNDSHATLKVLGKFSKLMRLVFRNSQHAIIPLENELKALNLYIELETVRLGRDFSCTIDVETINVSECKIPALLLQPFVENAIWHGIGHLKSEGKLELIFMRIGDTLQIEIIDNGVGRRNAALIKPKDNKRIHSLDIIKERLALLRTKYNCYTHIEITDAYEGKEFCGTKVLIIIPWLSDSEIPGRGRILKHFMLDDQSAYN